jgi:cold shock protein
MPTGTVRFFLPQKGYGFIAPDDGGPDVFVHVRDLQKAGMREPHLGRRVSYEIALSERTGKPRAEALKELPA